jgi:hypothetical protein
MEQEFHLEIREFQSVRISYNPPPPTDEELLQIMQDMRYYQEFWSIYNSLIWEIDPKPWEMEPPWEQIPYPEEIEEERADDPEWIAVDQWIHDRDYTIWEEEGNLYIRYLYNNWYFGYFWRADEGFPPYVPGIFELPFILFLSMMFLGGGLPKR